MEKGVKVFYQVNCTYIKFWATLDGEMRNRDDNSVVYDIFPWLLKYKGKPSRTYFEVDGNEAGYELHMHDYHYSYSRIWLRLAEGETDKLNSQAVDFLINGILQSPSRVIQVPSCRNDDDFHIMYSVPTPQKIAAEKLKRDEREIMARCKEKLIRELDILHMDIKSRAANKIQTAYKGAVVNPMNIIGSRLVNEKFNDLHREMRDRFSKVSDN